MANDCNESAKGTAGRRSLKRVVRPHVTVHEADLLCLSSEILLCKIKVAQVQRDMMVALESIDALVTRLEDAHRRVNEHREACKRTERPNAEVSEGGTRDSRIETAAQSRPSLH